ncbi:hypothetical protein Pint_05740 [Pistacia integerrima]|uniref:Uncharacterized protein n=1 Tax=Pistacia integerrima TaxID=434235 RepID=A0ACC0Z4A1_9ROSI|nr:hypothetical protein Pint_05740 [Pistacia integerrima]
MDVNTSKMINLDGVNYHAWKDELYAGKTGGNKLYLMKKFMNLKCRDGTAITDHLNDMQGIIYQLATMKISFEDEVIKRLLLQKIGEGENIKAPIIVANLKASLEQRRILNVIMVETKVT